MPDNIIKKIIEHRQKSLRRSDHTMGLRIPKERSSPMVPLGKPPFLICEIKKSSPSAGKISSSDPVLKASQYIDKGVNNLSVLTEEKHFSGALSDLIRIKKAFPWVSVLRKDFLLNIKDIEVSYYSGADAVLLIASMHEREHLELLYRKARSLGLSAMVEVHSREEIEKVRTFKPELVGINSRDLNTFKIDLVKPVQLKRFIDWKTRLVYESGITSPELAHFALSSGFDGLLMGTSVMKNPALIEDILPVFSLPVRDFWARLFAGKKENRPLVKICGITRPEDAIKAHKKGCNILGFIFAPSPRKTSPQLLHQVKDLDILKVGVVVALKNQKSLEKEVAELLEQGLLDAVQLHGQERPEQCYRLAFPYYKALRVRKKDDLRKVEKFHCPRVLLDSYHPFKPGGTGESISPDILENLSLNHPLWLAGGIGPENAEEIVKRYSPELVDCSSLLESAPGIKDHHKIDRFFINLEKCSH